MTTLALLAHHAAAPAFNTAFYATAATVIPVLFLAIAVQGRGYDALVKAFGAAFRRLRSTPRSGDGIVTVGKGTPRWSRVPGNGDQADGVSCGAAPADAGLGGAGR